MTDSNEKARQRQDAFDWAKKIIWAENPRTVWVDGLSGVKAVIKILRYFPETEEAGEQLYQHYYSFRGRCFYEDLMDWDVYDPEDEEYGLERFQEGWRLFCTEVADHYLTLKKLGFEFPPRIVSEGLEIKAKSEAAAKAEAEAKAKAKAEAEARWATNMEDPRFQAALKAATPDQKTVLENWGRKLIIPDEWYLKNLLNYVQEKIDQHRKWCLKNFQPFDLELV